MASLHIRRSPEDSTPQRLHDHPYICTYCSDTLSYVTLLSQRFFALLTEACAAFDALFADQVGRCVLSQRAGSMPWVKPPQAR